MNFNGLALPDRPAGRMHSARYRRGAAGRPRLVKRISRPFSCVCWGAAVPRGDRVRVFRQGTSREPTSGDASEPAGELVSLLIRS
jgi:hypothetical protein